MRFFLLFAGKDYYPEGGARDCIGALQSSDESDAVEWAEQFDADTGHWWAHADWKHLARIDAAALTIVRAWARDHQLVPVEGGHRAEMGQWELDEGDD